MKLTRESRDALARADFFLSKAEACSASERVEFEAFLEASIVFARAALHRFKKQYQTHAGFKDWWQQIGSDTAVDFFRRQRDWLLKEAPPMLGQTIYLGSIGPGGVSNPAVTPSSASAFYDFGDRSMDAAQTVRRRLNEMGALLSEAERRFVTTVSEHPPKIEPGRTHS